MLIRHKIILWFIGLTGFLFLLFSFYIYLAFTNSRAKVFQERIKNKAFATKEIYDQHDRVAERIITSIPEQSEYVFDEKNNLIFAINDLHDFKFTSSFFSSLSNKDEVYFSYARNEQRKEGYAFKFRANDHPRIIVITAFDKGGLEQENDLALILILGNIFLLALIGFSGYLFSKQVLSPINELVDQVESISPVNLDYRLQLKNQHDEIGVVTRSFNKALATIQSLVKSQRDFISYASHELRTPLAAIAGILETSINYDKDFRMTKKSIVDAHKESQRASALVNGLLQLSKIESSDGRTEMQNINIVDLLIDTISFFKVKIPLQEFSLDLTQSLPGGLYIELLGNENFLRTAFFNILDNASKYSSLQ